MGKKLLRKTRFYQIIFVSFNFFSRTYFFFEIFFFSKCASRKDSERFSYSRAQCCDHAHFVETRL